MALSGQLCGFAGRVLAVLFVLSSCAGGGIAAVGDDVSAVPVAGRLATPDGPVLVDLDGAQLPAEHAEVVRSVQHALAAGDLDTLRSRYAGDDWAGQAELLSRASVRRSVLDALRTHPANLGEGYVYPGFSVTGWSGLPAQADGRLLGLDPAMVTDPVSSYAGYQTAFFLDYDPPRTADGPLRWRGIAFPAAPTA